jgi:hypothetical protein
MAQPHTTTSPAVIAPIRLRSASRSIRSLVAVIVPPLVAGFPHRAK